MVQICLICSLKHTNGKINPLSYHSSRLCKKLCKVKIMLKDKGQTGLPVLECAFQRVRVKMSVVQVSSNHGPTVASQFISIKFKFECSL
uniref:Uncharacterized protein n=1 Tax=Anguilla anguilla TaxID=7936 RepID=A0A0E9X5E7_ANGAN